MMRCHGVRGAITAEANSAGAIVAATRRLLEALVAANGLEPEDLASVIFTATPDLDAAYPACAAREMGWVHTPLLCVQEMAVPGSLARCIRVLVHWNTELPRQRVRHVYLDGAEVLRPDLIQEREGCGP